ncbi:MAG: SPASM domain-containing protein [Clostridia bacterium]|nr:SPASM domain-containing protein [Clostridia bacterium]
MKYVIEDKKYKFRFAFDTENGAYVRTGILDENGNDTGAEPFMGSYPHLIDVGIMGHCIHGKTGLCSRAGVGCYQSGATVEKPNMSLEDFRSIAEQSLGKCNQFALGGRGDPDQHEHFEDILKLCRANLIVPSFTTSGYGMSRDIADICRKYCGAVAVSWYRSEYTLRAIETLMRAGVRTNIHYVLGRNSIDEAIQRLEENSFPEGVNAVIFLLHKPVGQGNASNCLSNGDPRVGRLFKLMTESHPFRLGMDSCSVPAAISLCPDIMPETLDTCEGGRFSCYIDSNMVAVPCSFDQGKRYAVSLREHSVEEAWNSPQFEAFRDIMRSACPNCSKRELCLGGCPLLPEIVLCENKAQN